MITIYHNNRCSKSRLGVQYLKDRALDFQVVEYINTPFTEELLTQLLQKLGKRPLEITRTQEEDFKLYKGLVLPDEEWIKILVENQKLIERPIVVNGEKAVVARPAENIDQIL